MSKRRKKEDTLRPGVTLRGDPHFNKLHEAVRRFNEDDALRQRAVRALVALSAAADEQLDDPKMADLVHVLIGLGLAKLGVKLPIDPSEQVH